MQQPSYHGRVWTIAANRGTAGHGPHGARASRVGGYRTEDFEISGTVESSVNTSGPHASLKILADGQVWNVVLAPPPRTERAGLKAGMIPVGETVTAYGHRHKDPKTFEIKTERLRWKDRLFNVYPDRS